MLRREMTVSNMFYPADKYTLENMINDYLSNVGKTPTIESLKALVCPHAGYIYSGQVASYSYKLLEENLANIPKTIVLLCPSHYVNFKGVSVGFYDKLETPFGDLELDKVLGEKLIEEYSNYFTVNYEANDKEHSMEVQLPFLKYIIKDKYFKILPLIFGNTDPIKIGKILSEISVDYPMFYIVSSDLSHYFPYDTALELDKRTIDLFLSEKTEKIIDNAQACGIYPWLALNEIANIHKWQGKLLKYQNSGDTAGGKDQVVGYASLFYN